MTFETRSTVSLLLIAQHDTNSRQTHREYRIYPIFPVKVHGFFLVRETPPAVFLTIATVAELNSWWVWPGQRLAAAQPHSYCRVSVSGAEQSEHWGPDCPCATLFKMQRSNIGNCKSKNVGHHKLTNICIAGEPEEEKEKWAENIRKTNRWKLAKFD